MATEIKMKTVNKNIKALNKTVTAAEHMKSAYVKTREGAENTQREESTPETYAEGKVAGVAERAAEGTMHQARIQGARAGNFIKEKKNSLKEKGTGTAGTGEKYPYQPKEDNRKTAGTSSGKSHAGQGENAEKQTAQQRAARESTIKRAREGRNKTKKTSGQGKGASKVPAAMQREREIPSRQRRKPQRGRTGWQSILPKTPRGRQKPQKKRHRLLRGQRKLRKRQ